MTAELGTVSTADRPACTTLSPPDGSPSQDGLLAIHRLYHD